MMIGARVLRQELRGAGAFLWARGGDCPYAPGTGSCLSDTWESNFPYEAAREKSFLSVFFGPRHENENKRIAPASEPKL